MKIQAFLILFIFANLASSAPTDPAQSVENGRIPDVRPQNTNGGKCCLAHTTSHHGPCCQEHVATCGSWEEARQVIEKIC